MKYRLFHGIPGDDVALCESVRPIVAAWEGRLPDRAALERLTHEAGVDVATAAYYVSLREHATHGVFARELEAADPDRRFDGAGTIVLVPGLFWEDHPELGSDGALVASIATRVGFDVIRVPVRGRATVATNAATIARFLAELDVEDAWLVSLSKGTSDLSIALRVHGSAIPFGRYRGWINVCGSPNGTEMARLMLASSASRLRWRATCAISRMPFASVREMSPEHALWRTPLDLPAGFRSVSIIGMPLAWHVSGVLAARYRQLSVLGPSDGLVLCANSFVESGLVYPAWGHDHYFRGAQVSPLLYRLFVWLAAQARAAAGRVPPVSERAAFDNGIGGSDR